MLIKEGDILNYYNDRKEFYPDFETVLYKDTESNLSKLVGRGLAESDMVDQSGSTRLNTGYERLEQSMRTILATPEGSILFMPAFGSKLPSMLFSPIDNISVDLIKLYTKRAINRHEPRVDVNAVDVEINKKVVNIMIEYSVKNSNDSRSFIYSTNVGIPSLDRVDSYQSNL